MFRPNSARPAGALANAILYLAALLSAAFVLFPPFKGLHGADHAFLFTGPSWAQASPQGLAGLVDWPRLLVQLVSLWAVALATVWLHQRERRLPAVALTVVACLGLAGAAQAQGVTSVDADTTTLGMQGGRYGVGLASSWPAYGISGTVRLNPRMNVQGVLGFFGTLSSFSARGWYRFNRNPDYDIYGYGGVGLYSYRYSRFVGRGVERVLGIGIGAGIESGIRELFNDPELPPIYANAELGLSLASFEYYGGFSALTGGFGIHYRLGQR